MEKIIHSFIILRPIVSKMGANYSAQRERSFKQSFVNCVHVCSRFSTKCSTFAVEWHWNSKNSQSVRNLRFLKKRVLKGEIRWSGYNRSMIQLELSTNFRNLSLRVDKQIFRMYAWTLLLIATKNSVILHSEYFVDQLIAFLTVEL